MSKIKIIETANNRIWYSKCFLIDSVTQRMLKFINVMHVWETTMGELAGLREYSSMSYCLNEIPLRVRRGLSLVEVQFTCVDAVEEFIAVGTNIGIVYWCNRRSNKIERLRPEVSLYWYSDSIYSWFQLVLSSLIEWLKDLSVIWEVFGEYSSSQLPTCSIIHK